MNEWILLITLVFLSLFSSYHSPFAFIYKNKTDNVETNGCQAGETIPHPRVGIIDGPRCSAEIPIGQWHLGWKCSSMTRALDKLCPEQRHENTTGQLPGTGQTSLKVVRKPGM